MYTTLLVWLVTLLGVFNLITSLVLLIRKRYKWAWVICTADVIFLGTYLLFMHNLQLFLLFVLGMMIGIWVPGIYWAQKLEDAFKQTRSAN